MAETIYLRGEGGGVFPFDLPLPDDFAKAYAKGQIRRVNEDGGDWVEPEPTKELTKELTPKEKLQADAEALGLDTSGTVAELTARIEATLAE
ncbi:MAG: SAP domain-containing protein [Actinomycetota bacterium]|nr:SAP domain-containing protein [Actinomycetota bacterium]